MGEEGGEEGTYKAEKRGEDEEAPPQGFTLRSSRRGQNARSMAAKQIRAEGNGSRGRREAEFLQKNKEEEEEEEEEGEGREGKKGLFIQSH
jgi:hypothetical protein